MTGLSAPRLLTTFQKTKFTSAALICDRGEFLKRNLSEIIRPTSPNRQREQQLPTQRVSRPHQTSSGFPAKNHFFPHGYSGPFTAPIFRKQQLSDASQLFPQYKCRVTFLHLIGFADTTEPPRHWPSGAPDRRTIPIYWNTWQYWQYEPAASFGF